MSRRFQSRFVIALSLGVIIFADSGNGQELVPVHASDDVQFFAGIGMANLRAGEYVYDGPDKVSQLDWESRGVKTATIGVDMDLTRDWTLKGRLDIGFDGDGHMVDRDWLHPDHDDWSHQSIHPDTQLEHYINALIEADRSILDTDSTRIALGGGAGYTTVRWSAYGGSYIYSNLPGFRDDIGNFLDGEKGISYQQNIPTLFVSANAQHTVGDFTFSGGVRGGASFAYKDVDDHWMRDLQFTDVMKTAPLLAAHLSADYRVLPSASLYLAGDYQKIFKVRGDTTMRDTVTGDTEFFRDGAAADFQSIMVAFGMKGTF